MVTDVENEIGMMFNDEYAGTGPRNCQQQRAKPLDLLCRKAGGRLVKEQQGRVAGQRAGKIGRASCRERVCLAV